MTAPLQIVLMLACLVGYAFFAGMEIGVISIHRLRLRHLVRHKVRGADILRDFLHHPDRLLGTTLVGTNLCMVVASVTAASLAARELGAIGPPLCSITMTLFVLIFCEYLPKAWFRSDPSYRAIRFAYLLRAANTILYPVGRVIVGITKIVFPVAHTPRASTEPFITREELKHLTHESETAGSISADERHMIHGVFELRRLPCRSVMVPREKMIIVRHDTPAGEMLGIARDKAISRLPVYNEEHERFVGIVHVLDVLSDRDNAGKTTEDYARPPQFVAADTPVDDLLPRMRMTRQPMALVRDAESRVIGLITSEDILEEIVGKL
jgi:CBS domain containing-hemolysin-like protein